MTRTRITVRHSEWNLLDGAVFTRAPANFRQSFAYFSAILYERVLKNRDFSGYGVIFLLLAGPQPRVPSRVLALRVSKCVSSDNQQCLLWFDSWAVSCIDLGPVYKEV